MGGGQFRQRDEDLMGEPNAISPAPTETPAAVAALPTPHCPPPTPAAGGSRELLKLAAPLVISQSFMTIQIAVDRVLLSRHDPDEVAAAFPAVMLFWLPFGLLQGVAGYVATFVAQYSGAGRPHRVGPAVWAGLHFALATGALFWLVALFAPQLVALGGHSGGGTVVLQSANPAWFPSVKAVFTYGAHAMASTVLGWPVGHVLDLSDDVAVLLMTGEHDGVMAASAVRYGSGSLRSLSSTTVRRRRGQRTITLRKPIVSPSATASRR